MLSTVLLIVLILLVIGAIPSWPHSRSWGYGPSGLLGVVLVVVLIPALTGRVSVTFAVHAALPGPDIVSFTWATSCLSVNGFARKSNWAPFGRFFSKASS